METDGTIDGLTTEEPASVPKDSPKHFSYRGIEGTSWQNMELDQILGEGYRVIALRIHINSAHVSYNVGSGQIEMREGNNEYRISTKDGNAAKKLIRMVASSNNELQKEVIIPFFSQIRSYEER